MAVSRHHLAEELDGLSPAEQRAFLRTYKQPIRARRARGKKYVDARELPRIGRAIEKRAEKALKRKRQHRRELED